MGVLFQIHCALNRLTHRHSCHRGESVQRVREDRRYFDSESTGSRNAGGFSGFAPSGGVADPAKRFGDPPDQVVREKTQVGISTTRRNSDWKSRLLMRSRTEKSRGNRERAARNTGMHVAPSLFTAKRMLSEQISPRSQRRNIHGDASRSETRKRL
jgi:hypothetical protein